MLTARSTVEIRRGIAGPWTLLSEEASGLGAWTYNDTRRSRPVPSIPAVLIVQRLSVSDVNVQFTCDDNERTAPLMFLRSGEIFELRIRRQGAGAGNPEVTLTGPATISETNTSAGARGYQFNLAASSRTKTIQA